MEVGDLGVRAAVDEEPVAAPLRAVSIAVAHQASGALSRLTGKHLARLGGDIPDMRLLLFDEPTPVATCILVGSHMRQPLVQRLIAVLCLVAFGLGQGIASSFLVRCEDGTGSRFEFACARTSDGSCLDACDQVDGPVDHADAQPTDDHDPHPCKDTPVGDTHAAAKIAPKSSAPELPELTAMATAIAYHAAVFDTPNPRMHVVPRTNEKPPDTTARLRTVILVV